MNDKKITDYLHLYLGCECHDDYKNCRAIITGVTDKKVFVKSPHNISFGRYFNEVTLILRRLSDMTHEEYIEYNRIRNTLYSLNNYSTQVINEANCALYFLSRGIDLFNLIDSGLAIDRATLNPDKQ